MSKGRRIKNEKNKKGALLERTLIKIVCALALIKICALDFNSSDFIELTLFLFICIASVFIGKQLSKDNEVLLVDKES